jgi:hypothetical protein
MKSAKRSDMSFSTKSSPTNAPTPFNARERGALGVRHLVTALEVSPRTARRDTKRVATFGTIPQLVRAERRVIRAAEDESACVSAQTEATNVSIEDFRLLHVTEVSSLRDDRKLGPGNGGVQLLCDMDWTATIHGAPQQQRGHLNPREEISGVHLGG